MGWPKGKPRGPKNKRFPGMAANPKGQPKPESITAPESGAFKPTIGQKREGGKDALMREAVELERQQTSPEKSEREKIGDRYMEETYGAPEEEQPQEPEETPSPSEEEQSQETEEAAPEEEPGEQQLEEKMVPESQWKNAENKMHEATTEVSNYRKLLDEMSPFMDWTKYQQSIRGESIAKPEEEKPRAVEPPSQDLFVTDYNKWYEQNLDAMAAKITERLEKKFIPEATNQVSAQTEYNRLEGDFKREFKDSPGYNENWLQHMAVYVAAEQKANPKGSPQEWYDAAKPKFAQVFGQPIKKPGKKVVPLESPSRAKEKAEAGPEKEMTMKDWEKQNRDYVSFRQKTIREKQGG